MISCCFKAVRGCNDRFAYVLLLLCLPFYPVFSFILSCFLVTLSLYYPVLFPLLLCLSFYSVFSFILSCFPCYSVFPFILSYFLVTLSFFTSSCFPCYSVFPLPCLFFIFLPSPLSTCQPVHSSTLCL